MVADLMESPGHHKAMATFPDPVPAWMEATTNKNRVTTRIINISVISVALCATIKNIMLFLREDLGVYTKNDTLVGQWSSADIKKALGRFQQLQ